MSRRLLLYCSADPAETGGLQVVFRRLAKHLRRRGHSVVEAWAGGARVRAGENGSVEPSLRCVDASVDGDGGIERYGLPAWKRRGGTLATVRGFGGACGAVLRLGRKLVRIRPDVVNVHYVTSEAFYFLLLRPILGYKLVLSVHGSDVLVPTDWDAALLPRLLARADAITTVSHLAAERVRECAGVDPERVRVIPNGVDYEFWSEGTMRRSDEATKRRREEGTMRRAAAGGATLDAVAAVSGRAESIARAGRPSHGASPRVGDDGGRSPAGGDGSGGGHSPVVLSVLRLHPVKGPDVLLRAFARVRRRVDDARLVLVGDGPSRGELQRLADELGIGDAVEFAGVLDPEAVRARLEAAGVFVLPSRSEGLPLALLEAMSAGVPTVATRVGGVEEVVTPGTGVLVPPEDPDALGEAICEVLLDARAAADLSRRGSERVREFSAAAADASYEELFVELLESGVAADRPIRT